MSISAQCPRCGAPIAFHVASSLATVCEHCKTVVARTDRALEDLGRTSDLVATQSPLALWLTGRYRNTRFQITGRAQLQHGAGGVWDEWYLAFDDGTWGWLGEAQGRFYVTFRQYESVTIDPRGLVPGHPIPVGNPPRAMTVAETGEARMLAARGELPYRLEPGKRYWYADLGGPGGTFATIDFSESPPLYFLGHEVSLADLGLASATRPPGLALPGDPDALPVPGQQVSVASVTCRDCGGSLELFAADVTERVSCPYCGALHDCDHGVLALLHKGARKLQSPAIPLGSEGSFEGETFRVIGFMIRTVPGHGTTYQWAEYLLYQPRLGFRWLVHADAHWSYVAPVPIGEIAAVSPARQHYAGEVARLGDKGFKIFQYGTARVESVAGEFYWKVQAGQTAHTVDYVAPPEMLSGEATDSEVQWSLGRYLDRAELAARMPGVTLPDESPSTVAPHQPFRHKSVYVVWGLLIALAIAALVWGQSKTRPRHVYSQVFELMPLAAGNSTSDAMFSEPFELIGDQNIQIIGLGAKVDNGWLYAQGDLYNEATGLVLAFDMPIEYYYGYEGGESWTEGSRSSTSYLSAPPPGTYVLRLAVERSHWQAPSTLEITIAQGVFRKSYWFYALLFLSIIPIGVIIYHISFEHRRWINSDFSGGDDE